MPTYFYWGEDDYQMALAVQRLCASTLDPQWLDFNYVKISAATDQQIIDGFSQALTAPFGNGDRLTWLSQIPVAQKCADAVLSELEQVLRSLPASSHLLLTSTQKPDGRLKSTKLLQKNASVQEFSPIAPWDTEAIATLVKQTAQTVGVKLISEAVDLLVESVGGDRRRLQIELEKLQIWQGDRKTPLTAPEVETLVMASAHNSIQLAQSIRVGDVNRALTILGELLSRNEPSLRLVATLTSQFRTWLWIKVMQEAGERDDKAIAEAADLGNPKRVHFLKQEVKALTSRQLIGVLTILLRLEQDLKLGREEMATLQTAVIEIVGVLV